jgi:hypothetical protein
LFDKYTVAHADGSPIDSQARYFVLRLDTDEHAQKAALAYMESVKGTNPELACDLGAALVSIALGKLQSLVAAAYGTGAPSCLDCGTAMQAAPGGYHD